MQTETKKPMKAATLGLAGLIGVSVLLQAIIGPHVPSGKEMGFRSIEDIEATKRDRQGQEIETCLRSNIYGETVTQSDIARISLNCKHLMP